MQRISHGFCQKNQNSDFLWTLHLHTLFISRNMKNYSFCKCLQAGFYLVKGLLQAKCHTNPGWDIMVVGTCCGPPYFPLWSPMNNFLADVRHLAGLERDIQRFTAAVFTRGSFLQLPKNHLFTEGPEKWGSNRQTTDNITKMLLLTVSVYAFF